MNIGLIVDLLKADPTIAQNIPAFIAKVNKQDTQQIQKSARVVDEEVVVTTSFAEMNGGKATVQDVQNALKLIASEPLKSELDQRYIKVAAAIDAGQILNSQGIISKFSE